MYECAGVLTTYVHACIHTLLSYLLNYYLPTYLVAYLLVQNTCILVRARKCIHEYRHMHLSIYLSLWMCYILQTFAVLAHDEPKIWSPSQPGGTGTSIASIGHIGLPSSSTKDCFVQPGISRDATKSDHASLRCQCPTCMKDAGDDADATECDHKVRC